MSDLMVISTNTGIQQAIPINYMDELLNIRDQMDIAYWRIGDITNEIYAHAIANREEITKLKICGMVGQVIGKAGRTIRGYAAAAAFFPPSVRDEYGVLPFSHFVWSMSLPGDLWKDGLTASLKYMDTHGIPPSVERLESIYNTRSLPESPNIIESVPPRLPQTIDYGKVQLTPSFESHLVPDDSVMRIPRIISELSGILQQIDIVYPQKAAHIARAVAELSEIVNGK